MKSQRLSYEKHGLTVNGAKTKEYKIWAGIKQRCHNSNDTNYRRYGGRGIAVCMRWRRSFSAFLSDMGDIPSPSHTIDRIDNDGNYEPDNCRWVTHRENVRNSSITKLDIHKARAIRIAYDPRHVTAQILGEIYGVSDQAVYDIITYRTWKDA